MPDAAFSHYWALLSARIAEELGLHFPPHRWPDLRAALAGVAAEYQFSDVDACVEWLLSAPLTNGQRQVLAAHLTIGETYFFRDKSLFDALAAHLLPGLLQARRRRDRRLRVWSAGCCTGEEAYSLAILLHQLLPDLPDWKVSVLATDLNPRFLRKAAEGCYGEWSFRDVDAAVKERYFQPTADRLYTVLPEIRQMVTFSELNLAGPPVSTATANTAAMDLILCRNVLMYFTPAQARRTIERLHRDLRDGGLLAVSPVESFRTNFLEFLPLTFSGGTLFQKPDPNAAPGPGRSLLGAGVPAPSLHRRSATPPAALSTPSRPPEKPPLPNVPPASLETALSLYEQGQYAEAANTLLALDPRQQLATPGIALLARALANQGRLSDALVWCDRWIAADMLDVAAHYLRAHILLERNESVQAGDALRRVLYLQSDFVLAHFALGMLARDAGKPAEARKHFANALHLLHRHQPADLIPESDGLTAERLTGTITALAALESTR